MTPVTEADARSAFTIYTEVGRCQSGPVLRDADHGRVARQNLLTDYTENDQGKFPCVERDARHRLSDPRLTVHPMDMNSPQDVGAAFGAMILGCTLSEEPPPADSPLGRLSELAAEHGESVLRDEHFEAALTGRPFPSN